MQQIGIRLSVCLSFRLSFPPPPSRSAGMCVFPQQVLRSLAVSSIERKKKTPEKDIYVDSEGPRPLAVRVFPPRLFSQKSIVIFRKSKKRRIDLEGEEGSK
jgi:hypothetical protein